MKLVEETIKLIEQGAITTTLGCLQKIYQNHRQVSNHLENGQGIRNREPIVWFWGWQKNQQIREKGNGNSKSAVNKPSQAKLSWILDNFKESRNLWGRHPNTGTSHGKLTDKWFSCGRFGNWRHEFPERRAENSYHFREERNKDKSNSSFVVKRWKFIS